MQPVNLESTASGLYIEWDDGHQGYHPHRFLRLECPCAGCVSEATGQRILDPATIPEDVHPVGIAPVGRYGMRIDWSDGHDTGIFSFRLLRELCQCQECTTPQR